MASRQSQARLYAELLERHGRLVADAFFRALDSLRAMAEIQKVTAAIEAGDIDAALDALHIDPAAYNDVAERVRQGFTEGGKVTAEGMPRRLPDGTALAIRFDGRNPVAESRLALHSSNLITGLVETDRAVVRAALTTSLERGANPRQAALDIVGRVSKATGKRTGGVLGLSVPQAEYVASARAELASADPVLLQNYLDRKRRDKSFDGLVKKAIRDGKPIPRTSAANALMGYENSLLKLRGDIVGKHETFSALESAKEESYRQAVASGKVDESAVTKTWKHLGNLNPRHQHLAINGQKVGLNGLFLLPDGTTMRHPHDPAAPVKHTAGCHCQTDWKIDFYANLR